MSHVVQQNPPEVVRRNSASHRRRNATCTALTAILTLGQGSDNNQPLPARPKSSSRPMRHLSCPSCPQQNPDSRAYHTSVTTTLTRPPRRASARGCTYPGEAQRGRMAVTRTTSHEGRFSRKEKKSLEAGVIWFSNFSFFFPPPSPRRFIRGPRNAARFCLSRMPGIGRASRRSGMWRPREVVVSE